MLLIEIFLNNLFPVFVIIGAGVILTRTLKPDVKSISSVTFYFVNPCLIFNGLIRNRIAGDERGQIIAFAFLNAALMAALAWLVATALGWRGEKRRALMLPVMLVNAGNFGLPVVLFAFGVEAQARAMMYVAGSATITATLGVAVAAGGGSIRETVGRLARTPLMYAAVGALLLNSLDIMPPDLIMKPVEMVAGGAVPMMLLVLGLQLGNSFDHLRANLKLIGLAAAMRLLAAPILAMLVIARITGVTGLAYQASVTEASTPSAVSSVILALQYDLEPEAVAGTVFFATISSAVTLSVLIAVLG